MEQTAIFGPFLVTMFLTLLVWVTMFVRRIGFLQQNDITPEQLQVPGALAELTPAEVSNPSDNFENLFEIPVLFYALALYLFTTQQVDALHLGAAWVFVLFRALHSLVHCTFNHVMLRFSLYLVSSLAVWLMLARSLWAHFGG